MLECDVSTASALMDVLHDIDRRGWSGDWYFRGQGDASWRLSPTLFRGSITTDTTGNASLANRQDLVDHENALVSAMRTVLCKKSIVPERHVANDDYLLALARHNDVKTRLLDWSRSPMVGAYFAAAGSAAEPPQSAKFSVFAMARIYAESNQMKGSRIVEPPDGGNENLAAQHGTLIVQAWDVPDLWDSRIATQTTPQNLVDPSSNLNTRLLRVNVPTTEAIKLLAYLRKRGVDGASVYPGGRGLVQLAAELAVQALDANGRLLLAGGQGPNLYLDPSKHVSRNDPSPTASTNDGGSPSDPTTPPEAPEESKA